MCRVCAYCFYEQDFWWAFMCMVCALCVALSERVYTNGVEWTIGLLKGKVCQWG
jgi:hypothetical protein